MRIREGEAPAEPSQTRAFGGTVSRKEKQTCEVQMRIEELDTPALTVDLDIMERNLR